MSDDGKISKTIASLAAEAGQTRRGPPRPALAGVIWSLYSAALVLAAVALVFVVRSDLREAASQGWFIANLAALALVFSCAASAGYASAVPGRPMPRFARAGLRLGLLLFFLTLVPSLLHMPLESALRMGLSPLSGLRCSSGLVLLGLVPGLLLFFALRRLAPVNPARTARMIGIALGAMGAFGLGFDCMIGNPVHLLVYHGLPILVLGLLGTLLGRLILRW